MFVQNDDPFWYGKVLCSFQMHRQTIPRPTNLLCRESLVPPRRSQSLKSMERQLGPLHRPQRRRPDTWSPWPRLRSEGHLRLPSRRRDFRPEVRIPSSRPRRRNSDFLHFSKTGWRARSNLFCAPCMSLEAKRNEDELCF